MRTKTRKFIWSAPLVAALAIIGALTLAGVLLLPNADTADAQSGNGPANVTATPGNKMINVAWEAPSDAVAATAFQVQYKLDSATNWDTNMIRTAPGGAAARKYTISGLANGTAYNVRARSKGVGDDYSAWNTVGGSITPVATVPGKVTGIMLKQTDNGMMNLGDDNAAGGTGPNADFMEYSVTVSWTPGDTGGSSIIGYVVQASGETATTFTPFTDTAVGSLAEDTAQFSVGTSESVKLRRGGVVKITAVNSATEGDNTDDTLENGDITATGVMSETSDAFVPVAAISLSTIPFGGMVSDIDSTSGGAGINITIQVRDLKAALPSGSSIVLYLEDDYQVPSSIPASSIILQGTGTNAGMGYNSGAVSATVSPTVKTGAYVDVDKKDYAIRIRIPDFCSGDSTCGLAMGQDLTVVVNTASGIKNPTEAGTHSTYVDVIGPVDELKDSGDIRGMTKENFMTEAKISLSSPDGNRGDDLTVTGSGFNNGTSAAAYVKQYTKKPVCDQAFLVGATRLNAGTVGSDDKVAITFEVTVPTFEPGNMNWICVVDGEGRFSTKDAEDFQLDPSIRVSPTTANVGDTVTVFAQDFMANDKEPLALKLASVPSGHKTRGFKTSGGSIGADGSGTATFKVPGWAEGILRLDAWGENTKVTVIGSQLTVSKASALPNELLTIRGEGFSTGANNYIPANMVTIDGVPLEVHEDSLNRDDQIDVSNSGQFVATVVLWPANGASNPTLNAGVHTIKVVDNNQYSGTATITVPEPVVTLTPDIAGPRDVITISGENWPVDNIEGQTPPTVMIDVQDGRPRTYSALPDSAGRWSVKHRVSGAVAIPSTNRVTAKVGSQIVKVVTFKVPAAEIEVTPGEGQPGDTINLMVDKMPVHAAVDSIQIAGRDVLPVGNFSTDRTGSVTVEGVVIPGLDPGTYSVLMDIDDTVAIGDVNVLAEVVGTDTPIAEALEPLGDKLVAVFYFDNISKTWLFYDPRPDFAELNTLTDLIDGQAYWVLTSESVEDVVLNNKSRSLTCAGDNCWSQFIW